MQENAGQIDADVLGNDDLQKQINEKINKFFINKFLTKNFKSMLKSEMILDQLKKIGNGNQKNKMKLYEQYWQEKNAEAKKNQNNKTSNLLSMVCRHFTNQTQKEKVN